MNFIFNRFKLVSFRPAEVVYPSIGRAVNERTHIVKYRHIEEVSNQVNSLQPEQILQEHIATRLRNDLSSRLQLRQLVALRCFITKYEYSGYGVNESEDGF